MRSGPGTAIYSPDRRTADAGEDDAGTAERRSRGAWSRRQLRSMDRLFCAAVRRALSAGLARVRSELPPAQSHDRRWPL